MTIATGPSAGAQQAPDRLRMTPGRWIALAIGVPVALVLIIGNGFSLVTDIGTASYHVDRTISLDHGRLVASANGSDLTVSQGPASAGAARLVGIVRYSLVRPDFTSDGTGFSLHCRLFTGNCGLDATLSVPSHTALDLNSGGGNMRMSGIQSTATLTSGGGNVALSRSGSAATVDSGGGNLNLSHLGGVLKFTTGGGDVDGSDLTSPKATMDTGGGNVTLTFTSPPTDISITSSGGNVTILLPRDGTRYDISYQPSGGNYSLASSVLTGSGSGHTITVHSGGGNITISQTS